MYPSHCNIHFLQNTLILQILKKIIFYTTSIFDKLIFEKKASLFCVQDDLTWELHCPAVSNKIMFPSKCLHKIGSPLIFLCISKYPSPPPPYPYIGWKWVDQKWLGVNSYITCLEKKLLVTNLSANPCRIVL